MRKWLNRLLCQTISLKLFVEKIGKFATADLRCFATPNRLLLNRQILLDLKEPYKILVGKLNSRQNVPPKAEQKFFSKNQLVSIGRELLHAVRTYFEQNPDAK